MDLIEAHPIFIIGRQHSGNTMLSAVFEQVPTILSMKGESTFFERLHTLHRLLLPERIQRIVKIIAHSEQPPIDNEAQAKILAYLSSRTAEKASQDPSSLTDLFADAMSCLLCYKNKTRWVQKATSYIFYVEQILQVFPRAKFIFLLRNPFDLVASQKRRGDATGLVRVVWGWNRGVVLALAYQKKYPENFLMVPYENLVKESHSIAARIFAFAEVKFDPRYLEIAHVNRSETSYNLSSNEIGINSSRVFYYTGILSSSEQAAVRAFASKRLLSVLYPELCQNVKLATVYSLLGNAYLFLTGLASIAIAHLRSFISEPLYVLDRVRRRMADATQVDTAYSHDDLFERHDINR
jgi:hypothetical protein